MARPEDSAARGTARNGASFDQGYDEPQGSLRRDPRRPFDQRAREEPPMRAHAGTPPQPSRGQSPGLAPQFDPYVQPLGGPRQAAPQAPRPTAQDPGFGGYRGDPRQDLPPQQGYSQDPYAQQRAPRPNGGAPLMPQAERYAGAPQGAPTSGRPGQTMRPPAVGYPPQAGYAPQQGQPFRGVAPGPQQAGGYDAVPPSGRVREPFFEAPPSARQAPPPSRQLVGLAQDGYGDDRFAETASNRGGDATFGDIDSDADDEGEYGLDEAEPRGRRGLIVTATLLVAIALGGGLGYIYKLGAGHSSNGANPPVVVADATPVKAMPVVADQGADPSKKTILERAGADATAAAMVPSQEQVAIAGDQAPAGDNLAGPRKVATVVVKPGEKIAALAATAADGQPVDAVPGLSLDGADPATKPVELGKVKPKAPPVQAEDQQAADAASAGAGTDVAVVQAPVKLGKSTKKMKVAAIAPAPDPNADGADAVPPDPTASAKTTGAAPARKAGGGYLIQVRSAKTQTEALAYFADLQQRFGDLLGSAQPDIQEADLGAKGKWYRLRIGPPGSGAAAKDLCTKLKASGLDACIVAPY